ncbi:hypothetical protein D3C80_1533270 [compost metagenome]
MEALLGDWVTFSSAFKKWNVDAVLLPSAMLLLSTLVAVDIWDDVVVAVEEYDELAEEADGSYPSC